MKKLLIGLLLLSSLAWADGAISPVVEWKDTITTAYPWRIWVPAGAITDNATGTTLNLALGNGSGIATGVVTLAAPNQTVTQTPNFSGGLTAGTLSLSSGSITDSSGAISFGNENLTTTGGITSGDSLTALMTSNLDVNFYLSRNEPAGSYNTDWNFYIPANSKDLWLYNTTLPLDVLSISTVGNFNFMTGNLTTTGTLGAGAITGTSFIIGANTLDTNEWATLDGANPTQFSYQLAGQFLDVLTDPKLLLGWLTPSNGGTEVDLSGAAHDATYVAGSGWTTSDQLHKGFVWSLDFDGINDYLTLGDNSDFTFGNSLVDVPFSLGAWIEVVAGTSIYPCIISKWSAEWFLGLENNNNKLVLLQRDNSAGVNVNRTSNSALSNGWHFVVATNSGTGGATAMNTAILYVDGLAVASTAGNNAGYVAMENTATIPTIGAISDGSLLWQNDMGMVFVEKKELSANDVWKIYVKTRGFYGL